MLDVVLVLLFCLLMGLGGLAVCVWVILTGRSATLDGILLILISLLLGGLFMWNFIWPVRAGEVREILDRARKKSTGAGASGEPPPA